MTNSFIYLFIQGSFKLGPAVVENEDLEEMSVADDITEQQLLMQKLKEQQELQKLIQDEMDTQSLATTVPPALSQVTTKYNVQRVSTRYIISDNIQCARTRSNKTFGNFIR